MLLTCGGSNSRVVTQNANVSLPAVEKRETIFSTSSSPSSTCAAKTTRRPNAATIAFGSTPPSPSSPSSLISSTNVSATRWTTGGRSNLRVISSSSDEPRAVVVGTTVSEPPRHCSCTVSDFDRFGEPNTVMDDRDTKPTTNAAYCSRLQRYHRRVRLARLVVCYLLNAVLLIVTMNACLSSEQREGKRWFTMTTFVNRACMVVGTLLPFVGTLLHNVGRDRPPRADTVHMQSVFVGYMVVVIAQSTAYRVQFSYDVEFHMALLSNTTLLTLHGALLLTKAVRHVTRRRDAVARLQPPEQPLRNTNHNSQAVADTLPFVSANSKPVTRGAACRGVTTARSIACQTSDSSSVAERRDGVWPGRWSPDSDEADCSSCSTERAATTHETAASAATPCSATMNIRLDYLTERVDEATVGPEPPLPYEKLEEIARASLQPYLQGTTEKSSSTAADDYVPFVPLLIETPVERRACMNESKPEDGSCNTYRRLTAAATTYYDRDVESRLGGRCRCTRDIDPFAATLNEIERAVDLMHHLLDYTMHAAPSRGLRADTVRDGLGGFLDAIIYRCGLAHLDLPANANQRNRLDVAKAQLLYERWRYCVRRATAVTASRRSANELTERRPVSMLTVRSTGTERCFRGG